MGTLKEAEGLAELGLYAEAWDALDSLPAVERVMPSALRVRIDCCPHLNAWSDGMQIAKFLRHGTDINRLASANFYLELARFCVEHDELAAAKKAVHDFAATLPDAQKHLMNDPLVKLLL
ncbi:hypothetical protein OJ996_19780 [Luteolibacter sp. GHJ8]|uniref:Tetratricopeptide repeat protein n=1 Tax=Luteolibacter rhizosphaerae TaxID=2989719 RepID=A0ABT3G7K5_9BACT|nr:hypothetical protein [Luteolibacter rhizosphaerae]MCW1915837.1 hypothetical protein [Luteolibacter rhizosphaerae]